MLRNKQLTFELDSTLDQCLNLNLNLNPNPIQHWNLDLSSIQFNKNHDVAQMRDTTTKESIVKLLLFSLLSSSLPYLRLFRVWKPFVAYTRCVCVCVWIYLVSEILCVLCEFQSRHGCSSTYFQLKRTLGSRSRTSRVGDDDDDDDLLPCRAKF